MKAHHYSGKVVNNSTLHFGVFLDGNLHGVMSYGPSLDKSKIIGLVKDTGWNEFLELNRMAFDSYLPRNSESRAISTSPRRELGGLTFFDVTGGTYNFKKYLDYVGATPIPGFQLRYIYFIDKSKRKDLTVPEIPFSKIDELGAGMYKGEKVTFAERHSKVTPEE